MKPNNLYQALGLFVLGIILGLVAVIGYPLEGLCRLVIFPITKYHRWLHPRSVALVLLGVLGMMGLMAPPAARAAWTFVTPVEFWLTNASPTLTNGPTGTTYSNQFVAFNLNLGVLTNSGSITGPTVITNASQPFPIVRDRGFLLHVGLWTTNAAINTNALALTVMQFATPIKLITNGVSYMVTNWEYQGAGLLTNTWTATNTWAGTTAGEIYGSVQVPASAVQNATLGRLLYLINPGTNWVWWDPTNTLISVTP